MNYLSAQYFLEVVKHKSISKAAQSLSVTQQNISRHIARLESEFGVVLFERKPYFKLTYAGEEMVVAAQKMLDFEDQLRKKFIDIRNEEVGNISIGVTPTRSPTVLPRILPSYHEKYPEIELHLHVDVTDALIEMLEKGEIDLLIGFISSKLGSSIQTFPLELERLCLVVPHNYLLNKYQSSLPEIVNLFNSHIVLSEFADANFLLHVKGSWTREVTDRYIQSQNFVPKVLLECSDMSTLISLAAHGMGVTFAFENVARQRIRSLNAEKDTAYLFPVMTDQIEGTVIIGYNKERYLSHAAKKFIELAIEIFQTSDH